MQFTARTVITPTGALAPVVTVGRKYVHYRDGERVRQATPGTLTPVTPRLMPSQRTKRTWFPPARGYWS